MTADAKAIADKDAKAFADLKADFDQLKASLAPTPNDPKAVAAWQDEMHQLRERNASRHMPFSRSDLDAMRAAAPDDVVRNIALRDARGPLTPCSPGAVPSSATNVRGPVGTGWREASPLRPPDGIGLVDAILEMDSARKRGELMIEEAKRKAAEAK